MPLNFEKHAAKGNEFVNELMRELGLKDRDQAARMLIAFLRTLRNHLTLQENFQFIAQLPMALKSVYVDQWVTDVFHKRIRTVQAFMHEMINADPASGWKDFHNDANAVRAVRKIWNVLNRYVSSGELNDVASVLPEHLKEFFRSELHEFA